MPDITPKESAALSDILSQLAPNLAIALSEQIGREVVLSMPQIEIVPLKDVLNRTANVLHSVFSFSQPVTVESVVFVSVETARIFSDPTESLPAGETPSSFTDVETEKLAEVMAGLVRGMATALTNISPDPVDVESCTTHVSALALPPAFALEGEVVEAELVLELPDSHTATMTFIFTPEFTAALTASIAPGENAGADTGLSEDDLAAMLGGLSSLGDPIPTPVAHSIPAAPFASLNAPMPEQILPRGMEMILDIPLDVTVELGRVRMLIKDVLELASGSIVELDRVAGEPVDLLVNGRLVAKGEVVVIEDNFGLRITEIVSPADRVAGLGRR